MVGIEVEFSAIITIQIRGDGVELELGIRHGKREIEIGGIPESGHRDVVVTMLGITKRHRVGLAPGILVR